MRTITAFTLALATTALVACDTADTEDDFTIEPGQELPQTQPQPDEMLISSSEFEAAGETEGGAIRGTADLLRSTDEGSVELRIRLEGLPEGDHAWHIHDAPCGQQGSIVVPLSAGGGHEGIHGDLNVGSDGIVDETVTIDAEHLQNVDLESQRALNVHRGSGDNPGPPIACANIGGPMNRTGTSGATQPTGY